MRIIMEFDGSIKDFEEILCEVPENDNFDLIDSVLYMLDYEPDKENIHHSKYGNIKMTFIKGE